MEKSQRKRIFASVFVPAFVGLTGLFALIARPRFQTFHTVDVVQLLVTGMCFGVTLVGLVRMMRGRGDG